MSQQNRIQCSPLAVPEECWVTKLAQVWRADGCLLALCPWRWPGTLQKQRCHRCSIVDATLQIYIWNIIKIRSPTGHQCIFHMFLPSVVSKSLNMSWLTIFHPWLTGSQVDTRAFALLVMRRDPVRRSETGRFSRAKSNRENDLNPTCRTKGGTDQPMSLST